MESLLDLMRHFWLDLQHGQLPELGPWNYLLLGLLIVWQGPVATLLGGAAASAGLLRPGYVFLAGVFGNLTADILWYTLGRRGNLERVLEWQPLKKHAKYYLAIKSALTEHSAKILLMAKLSFGLVVPTLVAAGMTRLKWRTWFPVVFLGETIWTGTLVLLGYYAIEAIKQVEQELQVVLALVTLTLLGLLLWFLPRYLRAEDRNQLTSNLEEKQAS